jgi:hypothetical protein
VLRSPEGSKKSGWETFSRCLDDGGVGKGARGGFGVGGLTPSRGVRNDESEEFLTHPRPLPFLAPSTSFSATSLRFLGVT